LKPPPRTKFLGTPLEGKSRKTNEKLGERNGKIKNKEKKSNVNTRTEIKTLKSPAMWLCVDWQDCTDVSENRAA